MKEDGKDKSGGSLEKEEELDPEATAMLLLQSPFPAHRGHSSAVAIAMAHLNRSDNQSLAVKILDK